MWMVKATNESHKQLLNMSVTIFSPRDNLISAMKENYLYGTCFGLMLRPVCVDAAMPTILHIDLKALSNGFGAVALSPRSDFFVWPWEWSTWLSLVD